MASRGLIIENVNGNYMKHWHSWEADGHPHSQ